MCERMKAGREAARVETAPRNAAPERGSLIDLNATFVLPPCSAPPLPPRNAIQACKDADECG